MRKLVPCSCRIIQILPRRSSHETKFASQGKTKKKTFTTQNQTMLLKVSRSDMRWGMLKASLASMLPPCDTGRSIGRRAQAPTEKYDRSNLVESLPVQTKKNKALVPTDGQLARFVNIQSWKTWGCLTVEKKKGFPLKIGQNPLLL